MTKCGSAENGQRPASVTVGANVLEREGAIAMNAKKWNGKDFTVVHRKKKKGMLTGLYQISFSTRLIRFLVSDPLTSRCRPASKGDICRTFSLTG